MIGDSKRKLLEDLTDVDFISICGTTWNLMGVEAWLVGQERADNHLKGIVCIRKHKDTGYTINKSFFENSGYNVKSIEENEYFNESFRDKLFRRVFTLIYLIGWKRLSKDSKISKDLYILCLGGLDQTWIVPLKAIPSGIKITFVIVDDGYMNPILEGSKVGYPYRRLVDHLIRKKFDVVDRRLRIPTKKYECTFNESCIDDYLDCFQKHGKMIDRELLDKYNDSIIICTQPLPGLSGTDYEAYGKVSEILRKHNLKNIVRMHPREKDVERYSKLGFIVDDSGKDKYTIEAVIANLEKRPKCVVSIYSSVLSDVGMFFNIPAISIARLIPKNMMDKETSKIIEMTLEAQEANWLIPSSYSELERCLLML